MTKLCLTCKRNFEENLKEKYFLDRVIIFVVLGLAVFILWCKGNINFSWLSTFPSDKYLFGIFAGIAGLMIRNVIWLFGDYPERRDKWVIFTYLIS